MDKIREVMEKLQQKVLLEEKSVELLTQPSQEMPLKKNIFNCEICKDDGFIIKVENDSEFAVICACRNKKKIEQIMKSSEITKEFLNLGFSNFLIEDVPKVVISARNTALEYLNNFDVIRNKRVNSISLLGASGSGKTHLLTAISNNLMRKGVSVFYFPFVEGFNELKQNLNEMYSKIENMKTVEVLFVDDLFKGRETVTQFQLEQMYAVFNYRYLNHLPVLLSSEKIIDELCQIDVALGSRIFEMSRNYLVQIEGYPMQINYRLRSLNY